MHDRARRGRSEGAYREANVVETVQDHLGQGVVSPPEEEGERIHGREDAVASIRRGRIEQIVLVVGRDSHHGWDVREGESWYANLCLLRGLRRYDKNHGAGILELEDPRRDRHVR